jgi:hypothetical protein
VLPLRWPPSRCVTDAEEGHGAKVAPAVPEETAPSTLKPGVGGLVALDLEDSQTVVSLTLLRRCLRRYGCRYHARIDGFSLCLFIVGCIYVGLLNVFFVFLPSSVVHRPSTDPLLSFFTIYVNLGRRGDRVGGWRMQPSFSLQAHSPEGYLQCIEDVLPYMDV